VSSIGLPSIIQKYVDASNQHDVPGILSCFSDDAVVHDEGREFRGIEVIESWTTKTIEKYEFQFKPVEMKGEEPNLVVAIEVSGTFDGSPVTPDYHFTLANGKITSLLID